MLVVPNNEMPFLNEKFHENQDLFAKKSTADLSVDKNDIKNLTKEKLFSLHSCVACSLVNLKEILIKEKIRIDKVEKLLENGKKGELQRVIKIIKEKQSELLKIEPELEIKFQLIQGEIANRFNNKEITLHEILEESEITSEINPSGGFHFNGMPSLIMNIKDKLDEDLYNQQRKKFSYYFFP